MNTAKIKHHEHRQIKHHEHRQIKHQSSNTNAMCWVAKLAGFNVKVKYQPRNISQDSNYLSCHPIEETYTNKLDLEKVSTLILNTCLSSENNWLSVTSATENNLKKHSHLVHEDEVSKIDKTLLKTEQEKDSTISLILDYVYKNRKFNFKEKKTLQKLWIIGKILTFRVRTVFKVFWKNAGNFAVLVCCAAASH